VIPDRETEMLFFSIHFSIINFFIDPDDIVKSRVLPRRHKGTKNGLL